MLGLFDSVEDGAGNQQYKPTPEAEQPATEPDIDAVNEELAEPLIDAVEPGFVFRPYQVDAVRRIEEELYGKAAEGECPAIEPHQSTLAVLATGSGKTCIMAEVIRRRPPGKVMMIAHRAELIYQGKATLERLCGEPVSIEMADRYARMDHNIIVATVQTLVSGRNGTGRMAGWNPADFSLLLVDEAHHFCAATKTYMKIGDYFKTNPNLKVLGVTATPDRFDEAALGAVFQSVAFTYEIADAIRDGWLVPVKAIPIHVAGLDYSTIRTTAGDLNGKDLANVMENEALLHEMVQAVLEVVCQAPQDSLSPILAREKETEFHQAMAEFVAQYPLRKTLVFAASVKHAETLCEIINRWVPGRACWVCGTTPKDDRKQLFADYKSGRYMFLVNCAVATEGFDEPTIEVVVMARPTKSRALYSQMLGRSTRALPGVVDGPETPEARRAAIAASAKPCTTCVDFVGNCGKHSLITPADILGGNYEDDVVELAAANAQKADRRPADMDEELEKAKKEIEDRKAREAAKRAKIRVGGKYTVGGVIDVFKMFKVVPQRERGWERGKPVSEKMKAALERQKLWQDDMTYSTARQLCQGMGERREKGLCTYRQASALAKRGLPTDVSFDKAHEWMDKIAGNGWQVPADVKAEAQEFIVGKPV